MVLSDLTNSPSRRAFNSPRKVESVKGDLAASDAYMSLVYSFRDQRQDLAEDDAQVAHASGATRDL